MPKGLIKAKRYLGVYFRESEGDRLYHQKPDQCFYILYKKDGRQVTEKVGWVGEGYTSKTASDIRAERLRSIRHGEDLPRDKRKTPRFSEMAKLFLEWAKSNKKDANDRGRYENYLKDALGKKRLNEISPLDLERIKKNLSDHGLAPATIKHALTLVRSIFNKAIAWGKYQGINPIKMVKMPSVNNSRIRFLTFEEAKILLDELKKQSQTTFEIALVSLQAGLRASEIFKLRGQDLDFQNGIIRVMDPKNKSSSRTAYMTESIKAVLQTRVTPDPNDFVFSPRIHALPHIKRVSGFFQRTADELFNNGVDDRRLRVVFHTLRHSFASWLAIQGTPLLTIKELLGHKSLAMTERYSHLSPSPQRDASRRLEMNFDQSETKVVSIAQPREN